MGADRTRRKPVGVEEICTYGLAMDGVGESDGRGDGVDLADVTETDGVALTLAIGLGEGKLGGVIGWPVLADNFTVTES